MKKALFSLFFALLATVVGSRADVILDDFSDGAATWVPGAGPGWSVVQVSPGSFVYRGDLAGDALTRKTSVILGNSWRLDVDVHFLNLYADSNSRGVAGFAIFPANSGVQLEASVNALSNGTVNVTMDWFEAGIQTWHKVLDSAWLPGFSNSCHLQLIRLPGSDKVNFTVTAPNGFNYRGETASIPLTFLNSMRCPGLRANYGKMDFSNLVIIAPIGGLPPVITVQPKSQSVPADASLNLSVTATGTAPLSYQWIKDATNISSASTSNYTVADFQAAQAGNYSVVVGNAYGSVTSLVAQVSLSPWPLFPNEVFNGGFELPAIDDGPSDTHILLYSAGTKFGGWVVESGNVHLTSHYRWTVGQGIQAVDLNGNTAGVIYQDFPTIPGHVYAVSFLMAGDIGAQVPIKTLRAWWGPTGGGLTNVGTFVYDITGQMLGSLQWVRHTISNLTASTTSTRIRFQSTTANVWGPGLDDVSVLDLGPATGPSVDLFSDLAAYYPLDGNATDATTNHNDGTAFNVTATPDRFGQALASFEFTTNTGVVKIPSSPSLNIRTSITISAWIRPASSQSQGVRTLVAKWAQDGSTSSYVLYSSGSGGTGFRLHNGLTPGPAGNFVQLTGWGQDPPALMWSLLVATYDGTYAKVFLNANEVARQSAVGTIAATTNEVWIGRDGYGLTNQFDGRIDDVRIYNRALSATEIATLYRAEKSLTTDTDSDGLPDHQEVSATGTNPTVADTDHDKLSDLSEFIAGTNPNDAKDFFQLGIQPAGGAAAVSFLARTASGIAYQGLNRYYALEFTPDIATGTWAGLAGLTNILGTNQTVNYLGPMPSGSSYYRAKVWLQAP